MATKTTAKIKEAPAEAPKAEKSSKGAKAAAPAKQVEADAKAEAKGPAKALGKPVTPSKDLAAIVGAGPMARTEVVSKVWEYIKKHDLQDAKDKRVIVADKALKPVFGQDKCTMFEMNKLLSAHLS